MTSTSEAVRELKRIECEFMGVLTRLRKEIEKLRRENETIFKRIEYLKMKAATRRNELLNDVSLLRKEIDALRDSCTHESNGL